MRYRRPRLHGIKKSALRSKAKLADISRDGKQSSVWRQIDH
jgi:hypothetical protein